MLLYGFDYGLSPPLLQIYDFTLTGIIMMFSALVASMLANA